jgi:hypothetical protein
MFKFFIILMSLVIFESCGGFDNPRDPKNICGGISLEDPFKMRTTGVDVISARNTLDGIESTISLNLMNCTGFDFSGSSLKIMSAENPKFDPVDATISVNELRPNGELGVPIEVFLKEISSSADLACEINFSPGTSGQIQKQIEIINVPDLRTKLVVDKVTCNLTSVNLGNYNASCSMTLKNEGHASTEDIIVSLNSINNGASITSSSVHNISSIGGNQATVDVNFNISVPDIESTYSINLQISDKYLNSWSCLSELKVSGDNNSIKFISSEILNDQNGDGVLSSGEYAYVRIKIKNISSDKLLGVKGTVSAGSGVVITYPYSGEEMYFGNMEVNATACGVRYSGSWAGSCEESYCAHIKVSLSSVFNHGDNIPILINLSDDSGNIWTVPGQISTGIPNINVALDSVEIVGDQNTDGLISSGEYAYLKIKVKNIGVGKVFNLSGTVTSTNNNVQINYYSGSALYFGDISSSAVRCGTPSSVSYWGSCTYSNYLYLKVTISPLQTNGVNIPFVLNLTDSTGRAWVIPFEVPTQAPSVNLDITNIRIVSEQLTNGRISPGEYAHLQIKVKNTGTGHSIDTTGTLTVNNPNVNISYYSSDTKLYFGVISSNLEKCAYTSNSSGYCSTSSANPKITIGSGVAAGTVLLFTLNMEDDWGNTYTKQFSMTVDSPSLNLTSSYSLISDTSGNGLIEPGEDLYLKLNIDNISPFYGSLLYVTLSELGSNYLALTDPNSYFGYVEGYKNYCGTAVNGSNRGNCSLQFANYNRLSVSPMTPSNINVNLQAVLKDSFGNTIGTYIYVLPIQ